MMSLLNIALRNLLNQNQIERIDFDDKNFVAYRRHKDNQSVYLYTKKIIDVYPSRKGVLDDVFVYPDNKKDASTLLPKGTLDDDSAFNYQSSMSKLIRMLCTDKKAKPTSIYLPIEYHGKTDSLGKIETSFTVLLEITVANSKITFSIYSPDEHAPVDNFDCLKKKILAPDLNVSNVSVVPHFLHHHKNLDTRGLATRADVWIMIYAAKLIEGKDSLACDSKSVSTFKSDKLFECDANQKNLDFMRLSQVNRNKLDMEVPTNIINAKKANVLFDQYWDSPWSLDVAALKVAPAEEKKQVSSAKIMTTLTREITATAKPNSEEKNLVPREKIVTSNSDLEVNQSPEFMATTSVAINSNADVYTLDQFRREVGVVLTSFNDHIEQLNLELLDNSLSKYNKNLKTHKVTALKSAHKTLSDREVISVDDVKTVILDTMKTFPNSTKGIWTGGLLKNRTEKLFGELMDKVEKIEKSPRNFGSQYK